MVTIENFKKGCESLKSIGMQPRKPFIFTPTQIEIFKKQGENVTDKTVNGYPYIIFTGWQ